MRYEFLKRLFMAYAEESLTFFHTGLNLCELREQIEDTSATDKEFRDIMHKHDIPAALADELSSAMFNSCDAYELQGFINGFRLCAMLIDELRGGGWDAKNHSSDASPQQ